MVFVEHRVKILDPTGIRRAVKQDPVVARLGVWNDILHYFRYDAFGPLIGEAVSKPEKILQMHGFWIYYL